MSSEVHSQNTALNWRAILASGINNPKHLLSLLDIDPHSVPISNLADKQFPTRVPMDFISRMQKGNINDPLLKQVLATLDEMQAVPGFDNNPLNETAFNPTPGLLHKYHGRVLLTVTGACAINCRYCFRRHFPYEDNNPGRQGWDKALAYIKQDKTINEVILSGGDPLMLHDDLLIDLANKLITHTHIKRLRIHTRLPIVIPERITKRLLAWLTEQTIPIILVVHCNHSNEINLKVKQAFRALRKAQCVLLNQSVLLKGVNDSPEALIALSEALFDARVLPYYLHLLDKVQGAAHFDVSDQRAKELMAEMSKRLPGFLVPTLVREIPGKGSKIKL